MPSPPRGLINPKLSGCLRREPAILILAGSGRGIEAHSARGTVELLEGDSTERRRHRSGAVQILVDRGLFQTPNHARFDVVEPSGRPCRIGADRTPIQDGVGRYQRISMRNTFVG